MTAVDSQLATALQPVRSALLARAEEDAALTRSLAAAQADVVLGRARDEADRVVSEARQEGEADAAATLRVSRARARRQARSVVLAAQRAAYEELVRRARDEARDLLGAAAAPRLADALAAQALARLGTAVEELWSP